MKHAIKLLPVIAVFTGLVGCGGTTGMTQSELHEDQCTYPDATETEAPGWICDEPVEGISVQAVGSYPKSAAGYNFSKDQAAARARVALAGQFTTHVKSMIKQFTAATGAGDSETVDQVNEVVSKTLTKQRLDGSKVYKAKVSPNGEVYVLVGLDPENTIFNTQAAIRTSMGNAQAAWQRYQSKKSHEELEKEMKEFHESQLMPSSK